MSEQRGFRFVDPLNPSDEPDANDPDPAVRRRYLGKYRGTVTLNVDPLQQGRLMVQVPGVLGLFPSTWAMPCLSMADISTGVFVRPAIGSGVWVEFEQGDPNRPIWVGGYWSTPQTLPLVARLAVTAPPTNQVMTIETTTGGLSISDTPLGAFGNVCLRSGVSQIILTPDSVKIAAPSVDITTTKFSVNGAAFTVTGV